MKPANLNSVKDHQLPSLSLLKFSTQDCPACQGMAAFDSSVATSMNLTFVDVDMKSPAVYGRYRRILLEEYPLKRELGLPTYLLVENPEGAFAVHGELSGGLPEPEFREKLRALLNAADVTRPDPEQAVAVPVQRLQNQDAHGERRDPDES